MPNNARWVEIVNAVVVLLITISRLNLSAYARDIILTNRLNDLSNLMDRLTDKVIPPIGINVL